jgi:hypothetical protein
MNRLISLIVAVGFGAFVSGCASMSQPKVHAYPKQGQSETQQAKDKSACEAWAKEQAGFDPTMDTVKAAGMGALIGAAAGAATGAAVGAVVGRPGTGAAVGAATVGMGGAAVGGGIGYVKDKEKFEKAYAVCMTGRGYEVK